MKSEIRGLIAMCLFGLAATLWNIEHYHAKNTRECAKFIYVCFTPFKETHK